MPDIPNQFIFGRVVNIVQGDGQLDRTQIAGEMTAGLPDGFQQKLSQLGGDLGQLFFIQAAQILRVVNQVE